MRPRPSRQQGGRPQVRCGDDPRRAEQPLGRLVDLVAQPALCMVHPLTLSQRARGIARPQADPLTLPTLSSRGMLAPVIDPDSAVPPYEQIAKMLRDEIAEGTMTGRIPSVHTIAEHHHVSHRVAARALEMLEGEGMIVKVPGEGHVVRHPMA
jgi:hypothetical protein